MDYLDITRAARRAGVSRRELQRRIAAGDLESFEGKVAHDALLRLYPSARRVPAGMVEFVADVKEAALAKAPSRDVEAPPAEALPRLYGEAVVARQRAEILAEERLALLRSTERMLAQIETDGPSAQRLSAVLQWLRARLRDGGHA